MQNDPRHLASADACTKHVPEFVHRQDGMALYDLDRLQQTAPTQCGPQDVMPIDHFLQGHQEHVKLAPVIERQDRAHQIDVTIAIQQMVEKNFI